MNPIEHVWAFMKRKLKNFNAKNVEELKAEILKIWNSIPIEFIRKLIDSMPKRSYDLFMAKGKHTRY